MIGLLSVSACQRTRQRTQAAPIYDVKVTGSSKATFIGTLSVNGAAQNVAGQGKANWTFQADELICSFRQGSEPGLLRFEVRNRRNGERAVSAPGPNGECRFETRGGKIEARTSMRPIEPAPAPAPEQ